MSLNSTKRSTLGDTRKRLFGATISSVAEKGYAATAVDEICAKAGVTKGAFFHHFPSKQSLTVAAVNDWAEKCDALTPLLLFINSTILLIASLGTSIFARRCCEPLWL